MKLKMVAGQIKNFLLLQDKLINIYLIHMIRTNVLSLMYNIIDKFSKL